jgi:CelD/BcsL family acetyltransferase involved in cellulose biosynthesis
VLRAEVLPPSRLGESELAEWSRLMATLPNLQRAFFSPGFALACEEAFGRTEVAVLHEGGVIRAFLPFQFKTAWHARLRLAERIGGELCDNAGLIADPGFAIDPATLLRCCGLGVLFITHLTEGEEAFGLIPSEWEIGHRIDLSAGSASYFATLRTNRKAFVQDTERRLRRAAREYGPLTFASVTAPERKDVMQLIADKRRQYQRTDTGDVFGDPRRLRVIEALTEAPRPDCMPVLSTLTAGERVLARHLGLLHAGVLNYWFPVYDVAAQKISPGRLLLWHMIERAEALGIRLVDRGSGDSEAKRDFSTGTVRLGRANFLAGTARGRIAHLLQAAEWQLGMLWKDDRWRRRSAA